MGAKDLAQAIEALLLHANDSCFIFQQADIHTDIQTVDILEIFRIGLLAYWYIGDDKIETLHYNWLVKKKKKKKKQA